jgi:hypothetical protein
LKDAVRFVMFESSLYGAADIARRPKKPGPMVLALGSFPNACFYVRHKKMKRAISVMQKRGRPATGKTPTIALRATDEFRDTVEKWAAKQTDKPTLSEAIRRLVELGLKAKGK